MYEIKHAVMWDNIYSAVFTNRVIKFLINLLKLYGHNWFIDIKTKTSNKNIHIMNYNIQDKLRV